MKIRKRTNLFLQQTIINIVASSISIAMSNTTAAMIDYYITVYSIYNGETLARFQIGDLAN